MQNHLWNCIFVDLVKQNTMWEQESDSVQLEDKKKNKKNLCIKEVLIFNPARTVMKITMINVTASHQI